MHAKRGVGFHPWVHVSGYAPADVVDICDSLAGLSELYPGGDAWLSRRLEDAARGHARCLVTRGRSGAISGVAIETPKPNACVKLSTLFVEGRDRGQHVGSALVDHLYDGWRLSGIQEVYFTVAHHRVDPVARLFEPYGFVRVAHLRDRYGSGRHEFVYRAYVS